MESLDFSYIALALIAGAAFLTAILHGATGMAGGVALAAVLSHFLGVKAAIPVTSCALIFSHGSRVFLHFKELDWRTIGIVLAFSGPFILFGATIFSLLSPTAVAVMMASFLAASFPVKALAKQRQWKTSGSVLAAASSFWGVLAGNVVGPGFVLAPFLLGRGMTRLTFVGSLAVIVLASNILKTAMFGAIELLSAELFVLGVCLGFITIPGNWLGKKILLQLSDRRHRQVIDVLTALMILNFTYLAIGSNALN